MSAPEEAPAESAPEKPSDTGEDAVSEDVADAGGRSSSSGKKEASSTSKAVPDGKLVKGTLPLLLSSSLDLVPCRWHFRLARKTSGPLEVSCL